MIFELSQARRTERIILVSHLGMTGRLFLSPENAPLPKHAAVVLGLGSQKLVFEDTRYFGRLTLDRSVISALGPEPFDAGFTAASLAEALKGSRQAIKVKLLDQSLLAGVGNIYASEALFQARIAPTSPACLLSLKQIGRLHRAIRSVLAEAIRCGSTVPLNYAGLGERDGLFYFGSALGSPDFYEERLKVYDRENLPCPNCGTRIKRIVQAARSTFFCPRCQSRARLPKTV